MPFTNTFDNTFPPDTQAANLLGQDIRTFKFDLQERMGAISGNDALKPNFAADAQPAKWNGVLFFATDTGKIYQFINPSWNDVTSSILASPNPLFFSGGNVTVPADVAAHTIYSGTVAANVLGTTRGIIVGVYGTTIIGASNAHVRVKFGGTTIADYFLISLNTSFSMETVIINTASNVQAARTEMRQNVGPAVIFQTGSGAIDTTVNQTILLEMQKGTNTDTMSTFVGYAKMI